MHYEIEFQLDLAAAGIKAAKEWEEEALNFSVDAGASLTKAYEVYNIIRGANRFKPQIKYIRLVFHIADIATDKPMQYVLAYTSKDTEW